MSDFPAVLQLSALDGTNGYSLVSGQSFDFTGYDVAPAGDLNGDGIDDVIITASRAHLNASNAGATYVVFGSRAPAPASVNLLALDGTTGFRLSGVVDQFTGISASSAGDFNGDGIPDLIIGSRSTPFVPASPAYLVFGRAGGYPSNINLADLNGADGVKIFGEFTRDAPASVSSAGDINGDGLSDIILAFPSADVNGTDSGVSYVLFGSSAAFGPSFNLSTLDGSNGFRIKGEAASQVSGTSVSAAGDINGDGLDDLIIGSPGGNGANGVGYVLYGSTTPFSLDFDLADLDGANGFRIEGVIGGGRTGFSVASAGDVNGDGIDDLVIGARAGQTAYVVFGDPDGLDATVNLAGLDGTNGFAITSPAELFKVAGAGDVNNDGFDDIILGAPKSSPNGANSGTVYVVFGRATGSASLDVSSLNGANGFRLEGSRTDAYSGYSVASAGDVNGDGVADLIIGAPKDFGGATLSGAAYIVFGTGAGPQAFAGTAGNDTFTGGALNDTINGQGGNDVLSGMGGDDIIDGGALSDTLYGGDGADNIAGGTGGDVIYGDADVDVLHGGADGDKLYGGAGSDTLYGDDGNDRLEGGDGGDVLHGGAGNDFLFADGGFMYGGAGNDIYIVTSPGELLSENADEGYDIIRTAVNNRFLPTDFEALELLGSDDIDGQGNNSANRLDGNSGNNILYGLSGNDTLNGNDGDDILVGGAGNDLMRGGLGADTFSVRPGSIAATLETDQIYDFSAAQGDIIDLAQLDANARMAGNQTFRLVDAFSKYDAAHPELTGQMTLTFAGGITTLRLDVNGDAKVDYQMKINGDVTGESSHWLL